MLTEPSARGWHRGRGPLPACRGGGTGRRGLVDAFNQPDGSGAFVVGDVTGHDVAAAVTMGQLRSLVRSVGYDAGAGFAQIPQRSDAAMRGLDMDTIASAVVVHVMPEPWDESPGRTGVLVVGGSPATCAGPGRRAGGGRQR